jgi:23S rRNA (guanosine2251-2'-O)-methyltransferase
VTSFRERNDRSKGRGGARTGPESPSRERRAAAGAEARDEPRGPRPPRRKEEPDAWVWGWHAVVAALANPRRTPARLLVTPDKLRQIEGRLGTHGAQLRPEPFDAPDIARMLPAGAAHQGVALRAPPPEPVDLDDLAEGGGLLVMLDQITDPQNIGAVFRSAAAFGARGLILQDRNAPQLGGVIAKASAGAVDALPHARVVNLSRALEALAEAGWRAVGLDGSALDLLADVLDARPTVLVFGSEGEGLRRLVAEHCDALARIPMPGGFESLNVSAAAAVALYEAARAQGAAGRRNA